MKFKTFIHVGIKVNNHINQMQIKSMMFELIILKFKINIP